MEAIRLLRRCFSNLIESFLFLQEPPAFLSIYRTVDNTSPATKSEAKPITPPQATTIRSTYKCIVEYETTPFLIKWSGSLDYPNLINFGRMLDDNFDANKIALEPEIDLMWRQTSLLDYGTHASIRLTDSDNFPIIKLAHPGDDLALHLIEHEFSILSEIKRAGFRTVDFDSEPITCGGTVYGYRMRQLAKLDPDETSARWTEIQNHVQQLHHAGFCHGDLSTSNIMKGEDNHLVLIDFSFSGRIGSPVPFFMPAWRFPKRIYSPDEDVAALNRMSC